MYAHTHTRTRTLDQVTVKHSNSQDGQGWGLASVTVMEICCECLHNIMPPPSCMPLQPVFNLHKP